MNVQNHLNQILLVSQYIEPLIGLLRDPLTICPYKNIPPTLQNSMEKMQYNQNVSFFLVHQHHIKIFDTSTTSIAPWLYHQGSQKILFDIGASYFNGMD